LAGKQEMRSEETKRSIHAAAAKLFAQKGYDAVTMRQIAREAGCSHTTIYLYYKDKEELLQQMAIPTLLNLRDRMRALLAEEKLSPLELLQQFSLEFVQFCLHHRSMHTVLFEIEAVRVDEREPKLKVNRLRNELFGMLREALGKNVPELAANGRNEELQNLTRVYFFMLYGMIHAYLHSREPADELLKRVRPLAVSGAEMLLLGARQKMGL
jgi:AcrR family transcriptional regulator